MRAANRRPARTTMRGTAIAVIVVMLVLGRPWIPLIIQMAIVEESFEVFASLAERRCVRFLVHPRQVAAAQVSIEARTHVVVLIGRTAAIAIVTVLGPRLDVLVSTATAREPQAPVSTVPVSVPAQPDSVMAS